jgi:hypothetical protein
MDYRTIYLVLRLILNWLSIRGQETSGGYNTIITAVQCIDWWKSKERKFDGVSLVLRSKAAETPYVSGSIEILRKFCETGDFVVLHFFAVQKCRGKN